MVKPACSFALLPLIRATLLLLVFSVIYCHAAPITTPDLSKCQLAIASSPDPLHPHTQELNCCIPSQEKLVEFSFENYPVLRKKVRRPAQHAKAKYIKKYNKAYELMRALPSDDPRSLAVQANIHCAFCDGAYKQRDTNITLQVHFSWLFLPWHRWYLYFHERILGSLISDPGFSLPYWNWDNQIDGNTMPSFFTINGSAAYDAKRNLANLPPTLVRLSVSSNLSNTSSSHVINENLNVMYQSVVTASTADMFMGGAYRAGLDLSTENAASAPLGGALELNAHGGIHYWTGDPNVELRGDMGVFTTASRDPIFYAHHSNVDRLWEVWKSIPGGRRTDPTDPDFLDTEFLFYDENANLVKVKARDALDIKKFGIKYKKIDKGDNLWLKFSPSPVSNGSQVSYAKAHGAQEISAASSYTQKNPIYLSSNLTVLVKRPSEKKPKGLEEVLIIQGLEVIREAYIHLQVFINLPQANTSTPISSAEYVGSSNIVPTPGSSKHLITNIMLEIGDNIKRIGIQDEELVVITILVQSEAPNSGSVIIQGMEIEYR